MDGLSVRDLRVSFDGFKAVDGVDLDVAPGDIRFLIGPNGAGKTTLVDLVSGLQAADGGELTLRGRRLHGPPSRRARLGLARTFQYPQLAGDLTVRQNLAVGHIGAAHASLGRLVRAAATGMWRTGDPAGDARVEAVADELGIEDIDRRAGDLTLGEQRLVEMGRALLQDPLVLLLDEPFAGADAGGVAGISEVIRTVRGRGHGVVLVDHNVDLVASLVDRITLLDRGRVAFDGRPGECLASREMQLVYFGDVDDAA